jgi:hypothetical protein
VSTVVQNSFLKCGFSIEDPVDIQEEDQDSSEWVELQGKTDCPSSFEDFKCGQVDPNQ